MMATVAAWVPLTLPMQALTTPYNVLYSALGYELDTGRPDGSPTVMTIAMVGESNARWDPAAVAASLAELAVTDELVVVYGSDEQEAGLRGHPLAARLRHLLPRHTIVALYLAPRDKPLGREAALLDECLEVGSLPVVVTHAGAVPDVAADLFHHLRADRVVRVSSTPAGGADLRQVWPQVAAVDKQPVSCAG